MVTTEPSGERASLGFTDAVASAFEFLIKDLSFVCVKREITFVRYESNTVFVNVYHGRASFELNVEIGRRKLGSDAQEHSFTIGEILHVANSQEAENYRPYQVTTAESVKKFVDKLARLVMQYAIPALREDQNFLQQVSDERGKRSDELVRTWELNRVRREVEIAWREKDFKRVIAIYEPVREHLTPAEVKKLEFAKKKSYA